MPHELCLPTDPLWSQYRMTGFGASEAAAACGVSEHTTRLELFDLKTGLVPDHFEGNDSTFFGQAFEQGVVLEFARQHDMPISRYPVPLMRHDKHEFMLATLDAELENGAILECKTRNEFVNFRNALGADDSDDLPLDWIFQAQQQMAVSGRDEVFFGVLIQVPTIRRFRVKRDDELVADIIEAEEDLWDRIKTNRPPEPQWEHRSTLDHIKHRFPHVNSVVRELSPVVVKYWERHERIRRHISKMEKLDDDLLSRVRYDLGNDAAGLLGDGRMVQRKAVTVKEHVRKESKSIRVTAVKVRKGTRAKRAEIVDESALFDESLAELTAMGAIPVEVSEAGSWYYELKDKRRVRVADHPPNAKTLKWMIANNVVNVRVDQGDTVKAVLTKGK